MFGLWAPASSIPPSTKRCRKLYVGLGIATFWTGSSKSITVGCATLGLGL
jgi:hypothetical protein